MTAAEVIRAARVELAKRERAKGPIQRVAERAANLKALNEAIERWQGLPLRFPPDIGADVPGLCGAAWGAWKCRLALGHNGMHADESLKAGIYPRWGGSPPDIGADVPGGGAV